MPKTGGRREGAGRPRGRKNNATLAKEAETKAAVDAVTRDMAPEDVAKLTPLECMLRAMHMRVLAGDWTGAASLAALAAPYTHYRRGVEAQAPQDMPPELMPTNGSSMPGYPVPQPDEPGPPGGIIE
jgi:hypothetical protein